MFLVYHSNCKKIVHLITSHQSHQVTIANHTNHFTSVYASSSIIHDDQDKNKNIALSSITCSLELTNTTGSVRPAPWTTCGRCYSYQNDV